MPAPSPPEGGTGQSWRVMARCLSYLRVEGLTGPPPKTPAARTAGVFFVRPRLDTIPQRRSRRRAFGADDDSASLNRRAFRKVRFFVSAYTRPPFVPESTHSSWDRSAQHPQAGRVPQADTRSVLLCQMDHWLSADPVPSTEVGAGRVRRRPRPTASNTEAHPAGRGAAPLQADRAHFPPKARCTRETPPATAGSGIGLMLEPGERLALPRPRRAPTRVRRRASRVAPEQDEGKVLRQIRADARLPTKDR